jgi:8-oxo-dGTP diphosphatase
MSDKIRIFKRRRGTAIIETGSGILVVAGKGKNFITPGGGANPDETRLDAAIREIKEETGLDAVRCKKLFKFVGYVNKTKKGGWQDFHTVVLVKATGIPKPSQEIKFIKFYSNENKIKVSSTTKKIIKKYYNWKKSQNFFQRFFINLKYKSKLKLK